MNLGRALARRAAPLLLVALLAPAAARAQGSADCEAADDRQVRSLTFAGNRTFPSRDLTLRVATTVSDAWYRYTRVLGSRHCLDSDELRLDVGRLRVFYRQHGYYATAVDTAVVPVEGGGVNVTFLIREGEPVRIDTLRITGLDSLTLPIARIDELELRVGEPFDILKVRAAIDSIKSRLRNRGYVRADVAASYPADTLTRKATIGLSVIPGVRARIGEIRVFDTPLPGQSARLSDQTARRLLPIRAGDQYSAQRVADSQRLLYQTDLFQKVDLRAAPDSVQPKGDSLITLDLFVNENYVRELNTEFGWAVLDCFKNRTQFIDKNFLGEAQRLELTAQLSKVGFGRPARFANGGLCANALKSDPFSERLNYFTGATVRLPALFGFRTAPSISVYSERRGEYQAYLRTTVVGGEASLTKEVKPALPLRVAYSLEYGHTEAQPALLCALFSACRAAERASITERNLPLAVASAHLERIRTDNAFNPRTGTALRLDLRGSARELGSDKSLEFVKGLADMSYYRGLTGALTFATRLRVGSVVGRSLSFSKGTGYIPPQERLYGGGPNSVRGFQQNELGDLIYIATDSVAPRRGGGDTLYYELARDSGGVRRVVPVGGNSLIVANFELRMRSFFYPELLQFTVFVDAGDVWNRGSTVGSRNPGAASLFLDRLKYTPGLGVRVFTPVGPFQANVGYKPYAQPAGAIYYDASVDQRTGFAPLFCLSPANGIPALPNAEGRYEQVSTTSNECPASFTPPARRTLLQRLTFTFSIGPDF